MSKRQSSKYKVSRRLGVALWGGDKDPYNKRNYAPGQHGPSGRRRMESNYGVQLKAKQQLKGYYGNISEKQFRAIYKEAIRLKGDSSEHLVGLLERRLDTVVYRLNFVPSVFAARQFINHRHITVNGKVVNIPSYRVKEGDVIEIKEKSQQVPMAMEAMEAHQRQVPDYLRLDAKHKGTFVRTPKLADIPYPVMMEPKLVVEYYSR